VRGPCERAIWRRGSDQIGDPARLQPRRANLHIAPGLTKTLAFVQENEREFVQGVDHGLDLAARDRALAYETALAENDAVKAAKKVQALLAETVGAVIVT